MLMKCPECNKEIWDQAITCPQCGIKIQTTKKTGQGWRLAQLAGILTTIAGAAYYYEYNSFGILICGIIMIVSSCIGAWWCCRR